jgi:signal transduction histidine kinase
VTFAAWRSPRGWPRPRPVDALVVAGLLVLSMEPLLTPTDCGCGSTPAWGWALVAGQCLLLLWRRAAPFGTALAAGLLTAVQGVSPMAEPALPFAALVGLYSVASLADRRRARLAAAIAAVGIAVALLADPSPPDLQDVTFLYLVFATAWLLGDGARHRREQVEVLHDRSAALEQSRADRERQVVAAERASIARELHDVIAHSVGLMVVQAESGAVLATHDPDRAEAAFDAIGRTGREALVELRQLLGVLHEHDADGAGRAAGRAPQPGLAQLPELTAETAAAGLAVELEVLGDPRPVAPAVDLSAYRIAQEALTNVLRHAGARCARVTVEWTGVPDGRGSVRLTVTDDGHPAGLPRQGRGLVGMRERAAVVGGEVHAGPGSRGGWEVRAVLPTGPALSAPGRPPTDAPATA